MILRYWFIKYFLKHLPLTWQNQLDLLKNPYRNINQHVAEMRLV